MNARPARVTRQPDDNLSELAAMMLRALEASPASVGVRAVVFLDDDAHGTVALAGYAGDDAPAAVIADIADHAAHYAEAYGIPLVLAMAEPGAALTMEMPELAQHEHTPGGPADCGRCQTLRDNQGWMWQV